MMPRTRMSHSQFYTVANWVKQNKKKLEDAVASGSNKQDILRLIHEETGCPTPGYLFARLREVLGPDELPRDLFRASPRRPTATAATRAADVASRRNKLALRYVARQLDALYEELGLPGQDIFNTVRKIQAGHLGVSDLESDLPTPSRMRDIPNTAEELTEATTTTG